MKVLVLAVAVFLQLESSYASNNCTVKYTAKWVDFLQQKKTNVKWASQAPNPGKIRVKELNKSIFNIVMLYVYQKNRLNSLNTARRWNRVKKYLKLVELSLLRKNDEGKRRIYPFHRVLNISSICSNHVISSMHSASPVGSFDIHTVCHVMIELGILKPKSVPDLFINFYINLFPKQIINLKSM